MLYYIFKRLLGTIPTLFFVILISFILVHLTPGSPFSSARALSPEVLKTLNHQYHLDLPLYQQFFIYLKGLLHGSFGMSFRHMGESVTSLIFPSGRNGGFYVSATLGLYAIMLSTVVGVLLGIAAALTSKGKFVWIDSLISGFTMLFISIPIVVIAPVSVLLFAVLWPVFPPLGWGGGSFYHLFLPVVVLSTPYVAIIAQIMRSSLVEIMGSPFIRTARAKGLSTTRVIFVHAIKPALMPVVSFLGPAAAGILAGSVIVEEVFTLPGIGVQLVNGSLDRSYNIVLALTIVYSLMVILFNLLVDVLYAFLDPKIKY